MKNPEEIYGLTEKIINIALGRSIELNIRDFVIASCSGKTVEIFLKNLKSFKKRIDNEDYLNDESGFRLNIVCVTH